MPKPTDLSVVYKLHCVAPEWIKKNEQQLAKAAGKKPIAYITVSVQKPK
ncbi:Protein of unknown function [Pyronema omphalodes CBS 100304]|uniref:Uncharacterized protein n=1 Tax=Pyronema omphalodes (strain CBS 100304) TaxID=1076935 RepID=U4KUR8_PYROM|nr:Protein of unknown function [Pyronema omphalodes CBS 100304]